LTLANRFGTDPSTLPLPQNTFVAPVTQLLSNTANVHLKEAAHRIFGGIGLPYSTSTPSIGASMEQKPIPLEASNERMSNMEADVFLSTLMPGMYASIMSALVETRKRLGTPWAEEMVQRAGTGDLKILDAGAGGAGVLAVRELLRSEWERMHEDNTDPQSTTALAEADGKIGGASATLPLGSATVLTGSDALRKRASALLENTTFIPRLPDYLHTDEARKKGKFDLIIAPHTLWSLREDHVRRQHMQNLWGMLSKEGGILILLEKGIPRGFELVAAARHFLLQSRIANADVTNGFAERALDKPPELVEKDEGMIIAPCTNHFACPMYQQQGVVKGRRDICHFSQRYVRPPFLQRVLGAKDKNWEDVEFAYLSIMRGRDLRSSDADNAVVQGAEATDRAFEGYGIPNEDDEGSNSGLAEQVPHSLSLPRTVLPPLKRRGHVILDLCTPSGTLERWTVPRSFSKQGFKDARKSSWGDLWALGAKTRIPRVPKIKKRTSKSKKDNMVKGEVSKDSVWDVDEYGRLVRLEGGNELLEGGKQRGRKVKGIRDKRDKKNDGNGRRKQRA
jgi:ribosomal protein RSM22 (predicted rRNA methylase)